MGSINPSRKRDYRRNTCIDVNQSYQVAYWKQRFGRASGGLARNVEAYLRQQHVER